MPWPFTRKSTESISQEADQSSSSPSARFAFRLFRQLSSHSNTNVFFSPSSIMLCLAMVHELASGETRQSMAQALEIASLDAPKLAAEIALLKSAFRPREDAQVAFANSVWLRSWRLWILAGVTRSQSLTGGLIPKPEARSAKL